MTFYFSAYSTPLLFGFVQGWVYALLLWGRGRREERLSDVLLGWVLVALCFEIWMYMLGFGGIAIFWRQLEFFPRTLSLLLPPLVYFYLKSQFDASFRFRLRDARHALPFVLNTAYHLIIFAQGPAFVQYWKTSVHDHWVDHVEFAAALAQQGLYLYWSRQLYRAYRAWTKTQFSDTETVSFRWFRNFLIALTITLVINLIMTALDLWLDLTYWQNWWGNLVGVVLIYYVSIEGYAQRQPTRQFHFRADVSHIPLPADPAVPAHTPAGEPAPYGRPSVTPPPPKSPAFLPELPERLVGLLAYMDAERPFLEPDLSLTDLARRTHLSPFLLSQIINVGTGKNFNDFVNEYRVEAFKEQVCDPANAHLSFLGLALNCGFNSKATFNRAFRKCTGMSPGEFVDRRD